MAKIQSGRRSGRGAARAVAVLALASMASAQDCLSLSGTSSCPAFDTASITLDDQNLNGVYPFLNFVSTLEEFDSELTEYVQRDYVRTKYQNILGCSNVTLSNTTSYYARYTITTICNAIVQSSIQACNLAANDSRPLCADDCALQATNEEEIVMNNQLCDTPSESFMDEIRSDFTTCSLPNDSLSGSCVRASENEPAECGFSTNLQGLCAYCATSSPNSTDSCCSAADAEGRCEGVELPTISSMPPLFPTSTSTSTPSSTAAPVEDNGGGLSGGAIAGIVIGSILGAALILGLLIFCCLRRRRRDGSQHGSIFNQPSPKRTGDSKMDYLNAPDFPIPGGRVARMTALEGDTSDEKGPNPVLAAERRAPGETSESDPYNDSPSRGPVTSRRQGSLSSNSALNMLGGEETSPSNQFSSPGDVHSGQSEQLPFFKDYYSQDEIHPGDKVAVLWAYQPRAADEFELERGDMLRVVGIWDDGWATGVRIDDRAEDYDGKHKVQRDSGVSQGGALRKDSPTPQGEVKAFPLVCVCMPEHWRKTIEIDTSTDTTSPSNPSQTGGQHQSFGNF